MELCFTDNPEIEQVTPTGTPAAPGKQRSQVMLTVLHLSSLIFPSSLELPILLLSSLFLSVLTICPSLTLFLIMTDKLQTKFQVLSKQNHP